MRRKASIMMFGAVLLAGFAVNIHAAKPMVSISASPTTIVVGGSSNLTWTSTGATSASINQGIGSVAVNGSRVVSPTATTTYTITVQGPGGKATAKATVTVAMSPPTVSFSATPASIHVGETSTLTWATTNAASASINNRIGVVSLNGSLSVSPSKNTTYTITVKGNGGTVTASATVTVLPPLPTVIFSTSPEIIHPDEISTLSWSSTNATSASIDNGIGSVQINGSIVVNPSTTTTYTITLSGSGGTATAVCTVTVQPYLPQASLNVSSAHALPGEAIRLYWNSENADSCSIDNGVGAVSLNGSTTVSPAQTTTYTLSATGPAGTTNVLATITIDSSLLPEVKIFSSKPITRRWDNTTSKVALIWSAEHGETAFLDNDIGSVSLQGSVWVAPPQSTVYTITVSNGTSSVTASVRVGVAEDSYNPKWRSYVPNELDNTVSVINSSNLVSIATVPVGAGPTCTAISPDGTCVFIGNNSGKTISKIDTATNTVVKTIALAGKPNKIDIHPDCSRLYAICEKTESGQSVWVVAVIDTTSGNILAEIPMGSGSLTGIAVHPNGELLYVSYSERKIAVIDTRYNQVINYILLNSSPGEMVIAPDGKRLYVALQYSSSENLAVIDTANNSVQSTYQVKNGAGKTEDIRFLRVRCDDKFLYASYFNYANSINYLTYLNTETFQALESIDCYYRVHGLALIPYENRNGNIFHIVIPAYLQEVSHDSFGINLSANVAHLGNVGSAEGNFTAYKADSVAGKVTQNGVGVSGVTIQINGEGISRAISTDANGNYIVALRCGTYTLTPMKGDSNFSPANIGITLDDTFTGKNFILTGSGPLPAITFTALPETIISGGTSTLNWSVTNATSVTIDNGIGTVSLSGTRSVNPTTTKTYTLTATGPGGPATASVIVTVTNVPPPTIAIVSPNENEIVSQSPLTVSGTVTADCTVKVNSIPATVTGTSWTVTVPVAVGANTLTAQATDIYSRTASATVHVTYDNTRTAKLIGTVTDYAGGQPITGVLATAIDSASQTKTAQTDAAGKYTISSLMPGDVQVSFVKSGYDPYQQTINIPANMTFDLTTQLRLTQVGATLQGLVKDGQTSQPIVAATVTATFSGGSLNSTSGSDGAYALIGIPLNTPVKITASAIGYSDVVIYQTFTMNAVFVYDFVLYSTSAVATVQGKIVNAKTLQVEGGVKITHEGTNISVTSAADGTFTFNDITFGEQYFSVKKDGVVDKNYILSIDKTPYPWDIIEPSSPGVPFPEAIRQNISGTVFDTLTGKPVPNAKVTVPGLNITVTADQTGNYQLNNLLQGNYNFMAMALDHEAVNVSLSVFPDIGSDHFDFFLPPTTKGLIKGTVTDAATGQPIRFAKIAIEGTGLLSASSEGDGSYTIINVPTGQYSLKAVHQEYSEVIKTNIEALDQQTTNLNFTLEKRLINGDLEGIIKDKSSGNPIVGAAIAVNGTSISASTNVSGFYRLENIPAGLNALSITAQGYPATALTKGVLARKDSSTPEVATLNINLDTGGSGQEITATKTISASVGGEIALADDRFIVVFPPNVLSADAIVTLKLPVDGPNIAPGDKLPMDSSLGLNNIYSLTKATQILIEPVSAGSPIPTVTGGILISGMYPQNLVSSLNLNENTVFPYFYNGGSWNILQSSPLEHMVDKVNNLILAALSLGETENGVPVNNTGSFVFTLGAPSASSAAASPSRVQNSKNSMGVFNPDANVNVWDKETLKAITDRYSPEDANYPNPNALPVLIFHGWQPATLLLNNAGADPNNAADRYYPIISDLADFTNGVYRPVFLSYNTRAGIETTGNAVRVKLLGESNNLDLLMGLPAVVSDNPNNGKFPFYDTIAYSMGGIISRVFQAQSSKIHNMEMIATPNHGTFGIIYYLRYLGLLQHWAFKILASLPDFVKLVSPGTADCFKYDDRENLFTCENPSLAMLNRNGKSGPSGDLTLLAGNDSSKFGGSFLDKPNDSFVPVDSVFCRTSAPNDTEKDSLLIQGGKNKWEGVYGFNHFNVCQGDFGLKKFGQTIPRGLSDWIVTKEYSEYETDNKFTAPTVSTTGIKNSRIKVDYNVFYEPAINGRESPRDFDRVVLVQYAMYMDKDPNDQNKEIPFYFIASDNVDSQGNIKEGKYQWLKGTTGTWGGKASLDMRDTFTFPKINPAIPKTKVVLTHTMVHSLKPNQKAVPLDPKNAAFSIPKD